MTPKKNNVAILFLVNARFNVIFSFEICYIHSTFMHFLGSFVYLVAVFPFISQMVFIFVECSIKFRLHSRLMCVYISALRIYSCLFVSSFVLFVICFCVMLAQRSYCISCLAGQNQEKKEEEDEEKK